MKTPGSEIPEKPDLAAGKGKTSASSRTADRVETLPSPWREPLIIAMILCGAAMGGFALTDYAPQRASWYWILILPVFAAVAIWRTWRSIRSEGKTEWPLVRRQIYHWLALLVAIKVLFVLIYKDVFAGQSAGLAALLLIALACALAGINFDWVFLPVGVILGCAVIIATLFRQYVWILLVALALAFAMLELIRRLTRPKGSR